MPTDIGFARFAAAIECFDSALRACEAARAVGRERGFRRSSPPPPPLPSVATSRVSDRGERSGTVCVPPLPINRRFARPTGGNTAARDRAETLIRGGCAAFASLLAKCDLPRAQVSAAAWQLGQRKAMRAQSSGALTADAPYAYTGTLNVSTPYGVRYALGITAHHGLWGQPVFFSELVHEVAMRLRISEWSGDRSRQPRQALNNLVVASISVSESTVRIALRVPEPPFDDGYDVLATRGVHRRIELRKVDGNDSKVVTLGSAARPAVFRLVDTLLRESQVVGTGRCRLLKLRLDGRTVGERADVLQELVYRVAPVFIADLDQCARFLPDDLAQRWRWELENVASRARPNWRAISSSEVDWPHQRKRRPDTPVTPVLARGSGPVATARPATVPSRGDTNEETFDSATRGIVSGVLDVSSILRKRKRADTKDEKTTVWTRGRPEPS